MAVASSVLGRLASLAAATDPASVGRHPVGLRFCSPLGLPLILPARNSGRCPLGIRAVAKEPVELSVDEEESARFSVEGSCFLEKALIGGGIALSPLLAGIEVANAAEGEYGIFEGRSLALLHPIIMGGLLAYTLYAGYLGWQWRRIREIQSEINVLKKEVKPVAVTAGGKDSSPEPPSPVEQQINKLTEERKELLKGNFRDRHFNAGSLLLGGGIFIAVEGCVNTYLRTGKLFPGPHLFAGAGIVVLWALAASLVPAMQKGDETARSLHIGLNALNVALFLWQVPTGLEIVGKVFEFTTWP